MSVIHYKFKSSLEYDSLTFDGLHLKLGELKRLILHQKKLGRTGDFDLQVTNAQTKQVYTSDEDLIPKNASVVVARIPVAGVKNPKIRNAQQMEERATPSPPQKQVMLPVRNPFTYTQYQSVSIGTFS